MEPDGITRLYGASTQIGYDAAAPASEWRQRACLEDAGAKLLPPGQDTTLQRLGVPGAPEAVTDRPERKRRQLGVLGAAGRVLGRCLRRVRRLLPPSAAI